MFTIHALLKLLKKFHANLLLAVQLTDISLIGLQQ
ncbi:hypothetical protein [Shigella phage ESh4]|nr:hypothetical protein [Shigella phage ESh4]